MANKHNIQQLIQTHIASNNTSCRSMGITLFGDVISQHGGWVWLGSLIDTLGLFGFNERSVRTAVYRLVQSEWLESKKIGRKSYYCFTETANSHSERVTRRFYLSEPLEWNGKWLLVLPVSVPEEQKEEFKKSLLWLGFNTLTSGIYAHPSSDRRSLDEVLIEQKLTKDVAVFSAQMEDLYSQTVTKTLINEKWSIKELQDSYQQFLDFYRNLQSKVNFSELTDTESFMLRTTLIHDYRRIILKDPDLPSEILPNGWVGYEAQDLLKRIYLSLAESSCKYIESQLENAHGTLPSASRKFFARFGKIKQFDS